MFVQVFHGKVKDADTWSRQIDTWRKEVRPKTSGFLGSTSGVTADGTMITVARFESQEKAVANSSLPEQAAWFEETSKAFDGEITFHDCTEVDDVLDGGSNKAGFVQVMQGRAKDQQLMRSTAKGFDSDLRKIRPDLLGGLIAWHDDGGFTQTAYFTSEAAARINEKEMAQSPMFVEFMSQIDGDVTFYDLTKPDFN